MAVNLTKSQTLSVPLKSIMASFLLAIIHILLYHITICVPVFVFYINLMSFWRRKSLP